MITAFSRFFLRISYFVASGFGSGYLPKAPGTWGSVLGLILALLCFIEYEEVGLAILAAFSGLVGLVCTAFIFEKDFQKLADPDPSFIVIDEIAGVAVTLLIAYFMTTSLLTIEGFFVGFVFFRIFDIWKPWPISWVDDCLAQHPKTAPLGVMLDDVMAALPAGVLTALAQDAIWRFL